MFTSYKSVFVLHCSADKDLLVFSALDQMLIGSLLLLAINIACASELLGQCFPRGILQAKFQ